MLQHVDLVTSSPRSTLRILDMASLGALVFSLLCILFIFFCSLVYADSNLHSIAPLSRCALSIVHCPFSFALCLRRYMYILHIRFILQLQYLICSSFFDLAPMQIFHPPCFAVNLFRLEYLNNCLQIAVCRLRLNCFLLTSLPATPLLYINAALWKLRIYDFVAVQIVGIVGKVFPVAKHALYAVLYTQSVANYLCRTPLPFSLLCGRKCECCGLATLHTVST